MGLFLSFLVPSVSSSFCNDIPVRVIILPSRVSVLRRMGVGGMYPVLLVVVLVKELSIVTVSVFSPTLVLGSFHTFFLTLNLSFIPFCLGTLSVLVLRHLTL